MQTVNLELKRLYKGKWKDEVLKIYVRTGERSAIFSGFTEKTLFKELSHDEASKLFSSTGLEIDGITYKATNRQAGRTGKSITTFHFLR